MKDPEVRDGWTKLVVHILKDCRVSKAGGLWWLDGVDGVVGLRWWWRRVATNGDEWRRWVTGTSTQRALTWKFLCVLLELFSSRVSVDQDLSVIVAETINDDDVKQRLVPIVFHACVTRRRSAGSKTRLSCSHVHEKNK